MTTPLGQTVITSHSHYSRSFLTVRHASSLQQVLCTIPRVNFSEHRSDDKTTSCWTMILTIQRMMCGLHSLTQATSPGHFCYPHSVPQPFRFWMHYASFSLQSLSCAVHSSGSALPHPFMGLAFIHHSDLNPYIISLGKLLCLPPPHLGQVSLLLAHI